MTKQRRGSGEGALFQDKDGVWHARIQIGTYPSGARKYKEFKGQKKSEVSAKKREYEQRMKDGGGNNDGPLFKDFIKEWAVSVKRTELKPTSYERLLRSIDQQIVPCIGKHRLGKLTQKTIQDELINHLLETPNPKTKKPCSYSVINKAYVYTKACLQYAVDTGQLIKNPCMNVVRPNKALLPAKEIRFFNDDEMHRLFQAADEANQTFAWAYKFIAYTGLRRGEMLALRKDCVDLEKKTICIRRTIIATKQNKDGATNIMYSCQEATKNGRARYVQLSDSAIKCIKGAYENCLNESDYLVTGSGEILSEATFRKVYLSICKKAGIENPQGIHTLRHTFASKLIRNHVDIKTVSELVGHANVSFTYKTYVHLIDAQKIAAVDGIDF